jgi:hypothetical protein
MNKFLKLNHYHSRNEHYQREIMKEDITKNLIQKSTISTSEDFTDTLLLKIETEKAIEPLSDIKHIEMFRYAILGILVGGTVFFISMYLNFFPKLDIFNIQLRISKIPFLIITTLLLLLGTNHLLRMHELVNFKTKN